MDRHVYNNWRLPNKKFKTSEESIAETKRLREERNAFFAEQEKRHKEIEKRSKEKEALISENTKS